jgi:hypothetical protein
MTKEIKIYNNKIFNMIKEIKKKTAWTDFSHKGREWEGERGRRRKVENPFQNINISACIVKLRNNFYL